MQAFVMLSAERETNTGRENVRRTRELDSYLRGTFTRSVYHYCLGRYDGFTENSFRIDLPEHNVFDASMIPEAPEFAEISDELYAVWELAGSFNQESILYVNPLGEAFLIFHDKVVFHLGKKVDVDNVVNERAFTIDLETGVQWVVR